MKGTWQNNSRAGFWKGGKMKITMQYYTDTTHVTSTTTTTTTGKKCDTKRRKTKAKVEPCGVYSGTRVLNEPRETRIRNGKLREEMSVRNASLTFPLAKWRSEKKQTSHRDLRDKRKDPWWKQRWLKSRNILYILYRPILRNIIYFNFLLLFFLLFLLLLLPSNRCWETKSQ